MAKTLAFAPGTILVIDRGYVDYAWFASLTRQGVFFVTRLKDNAVYTIVGTRAVPANRHIMQDELIALTGPGALAKCPYPLRRVLVFDPEMGMGDLEGADLGAEDPFASAGMPPEMMAPTGMEMA